MDLIDALTYSALAVAANQALYSCALVVHTDSVLHIHKTEEITKLLQPYHALPMDFNALEYLVLSCSIFQHDFQDIARKSQQYRASCSASASLTRDIYNSLVTLNHRKGLKGKVKYAAGAYGSDLHAMLLVEIGSKWELFEAVHPCRKLEIEDVKDGSRFIFEEQRQTTKEFETHLGSKFTVHAKNFMNTDLIRPTMSSLLYPGGLVQLTIASMQRLSQG